jgi:hypothetical protein
MQVVRLAAIGVILIGSALVHGQWTGRWDAMANSPHAPADLSHVPMRVGDWNGQDVEVNERDLPSVSAVFMCRYTHRTSGQTVTVSLVGGRPSFVAVHTPDMCFVGGGYELSAPPVRKAFDIEPGSAQAQFFVARFRKVRLDTSEHLRVFWAWTDGTGWVAPSNPRLRFARCQMLYKIYFVRSVENQDETADPGPCVDLMQALLPRMTEVLFCPNGATE